MAIIKLASMFSDIIGRTKGTVFQRTQGGLIMRAERKHINRQTNSQLWVRSGLTQIQAAWRSLSAADAAAWTAYAISRNKGQHKSPGKAQSAQALFTGENMIRWKMSQSVPAIVPVIITSPVIQPPAAVISVVSIKTDGAILTVLLDRAINAAAAFLMLKMSRPLSNSQASQYNKLTIVPFTQTTQDHWDIETEYIALFGRLPAVGEFINTDITFAVITDNGASIATRQRIEVAAI